MIFLLEMISGSGYAKLKLVILQNMLTATHKKTII